MAEKVGGIYYDVSLDTKPLVDGTRIVDRETQRAAQSFNAITAAVKLYAAALTALKAIRMADEVELLRKRVEVAAGSVEAGAAAFRELEAISRRTQTSIDANATVFQRLNASLLQMGGTQEDTLRLTELLGQAIKVSGASAAEGRSAMLQFAQALGSGKVAGDELRSLLENAPYLMRQLADGIGVPIGALKQLGEDGKLTADVVVNALTKATDRIAADFQKLPVTFDASVTAMNDAAARAVEQLDKVSGSSAAATGIVRGTGEAFDGLAKAIADMRSEGEQLDRGKVITEWAENTRTVLSYVVDAADGVSRVFQYIGITIGALVAKAKTLATWRTGDFLAKNQAINEAAAADEARLLRTPLAGERMRAAWEQEQNQRRQESRGFTPSVPGSPLRPRAGSTTGGGSVGKGSRDPIGDAEDNIRKRLDDWWYRNQEALDALDEKSAADAAKRQAEGRRLAQGAILDADPIAKLEAELQAKTALLAEYAAIDQENLALYAEARVALEQETAQRIAEIQNKRRLEEAAAQAAVLQNYAALFGSMSDVLKAFGGEQSKAYKAMFAVSKAFAIAEAIVNIQAGIAKAANERFPLNIAAMATVAAQTAGIVATIQGTSFGGGRQYGGPASAGTLYRINEGGRPEMFTARNGAQYMLPTADGTVTPAGGGGRGGRGGLTLIQHNSFATGVSRAEVLSAVADGNRALFAELQAQGVI